MKPGRGDWQHYLPPTVSEFGESVKEHDAGAILRLETRFEHMHPETVDIIDEARADTGRENGRIVGHLGCIRDRGALRSAGRARFSNKGGGSKNGRETLHQPAARKRAATKRR